MPTVREFFLTEAGEHLDALTSLLAQADAATVHEEELHRRARGLRGSAQMAREAHVERVASALEAAARAVVRGEMEWTVDLLDRARQTVDDLRMLVRDDPEDAAAARYAETATARWYGLGLQVSTSPAASGESTPVPNGSAGPPRDGSAAELRRFAAQEAGGVLTELEAALPVLAREPLNREPLKAILRRQRALLGAAALDSLPALAETLRALDEVTRLVARHKAAVEGLWLEPYRAARDVLQELVPRVAGHEAADPPQPAFDRLRDARARLAEQYGGGAAERRPAPAAEGVSADDQEMFRREAGRLLDRMRRMAEELSRASDGRRAAVRSDLGDALAAVRDNARTFGFGDVAEIADRAIARLATLGAADVTELADRLRDAAGLPGPATDEVVPIETLCYRGSDALRRALELESRVRAAAADPSGRELVDEVFDLMRLALE